MIDAYGEVAAVMTRIAATRGFAPSASERLRAAAAAAPRILGFTDTAASAAG